MSSTEFIQSVKARTAPARRKKICVDTSYSYDLITQGK